MWYWDCCIFYFFNKSFSVKRIFSNNWIDAFIDFDVCIRLKLKPSKAYNARTFLSQSSLPFLASLFTRVSWAPCEMWHWIVLYLYFDVGSLPKVSQTLKTEKIMDLLIENAITSFNYLKERERERERERESSKRQ